MSTSFVPFEVRFASDGSVWVAGQSRIAHSTLAGLVGETGPCDAKGRKVHVSPSLGRPLTVARLRRGLRVRSGEPSRLTANFTYFTGNEQRADLGGLVGERLIRRAGATVTVGIGAKEARKLRKLLDAGHRLTVNVDITVYDRDGNPTETSLARRTPPR